jgi:hypothetical protein
VEGPLTLCAALGGGIVEGGGGCFRFFGRLAFAESVRRNRWPIGGWFEGARSETVELGSV